MQRKDDSDIKIFEPSDKSEKDSDILACVEGMNHHRQNGNVDKAKVLGIFLAEDAFDDKRKDLVDEIFLSKEIFPQVCALMLFSTEAALNYYLPSQQLSAIAINSLHEKISEQSSPIYEDVMNSPAFSFYYLSVRKGGSDIPRDIGEAFSMLCRHEGEDLFIEEGKKLYNMMLEFVQAKIFQIEFAD